MAKQLETSSECDPIQFVLNIPKVAKATISEIRDHYPELGDEFEVRRFTLRVVGLNEEYIRDLAERSLIKLERKGPFGLEYLNLEEATLAYIIKRNLVLKLTSGKSVDWDESIAMDAREVIQQESAKIRDQEAFEKARKKRSWYPNWY